MTTWLTDSNGNRCSVEYFGSKEAAQAALDSLKNCQNCTNCSDCSDCSRCWDCLGCLECSDCSGCSYCSGCWACSDCSDCSRCWDCLGCLECSGCYQENGLKNQEQKTFIEIPVIPNIHQAVYAAVTAKHHHLEMSTWHTCNTTHCRAGWVVTLAGEKGKALENYFNTELAAMLIYRENGYQINPARFYDSNEDALADMKRLAEME